MKRDLIACMIGKHEQVAMVDQKNYLEKRKSREMTISYYIVDPLRKKTFEEFEKYWDTHILPKFSAMFEEFSEEHRGKLADDILLQIENIPWKILARPCPIMDDCYKDRFGFTTNANGKFVFNHYGKMSEINLPTISSKNQLQYALSQNPTYYIIDENGISYTFGKFCDEIGL